MKTWYFQVVSHLPHEMRSEVRDQTLRKSGRFGYPILNLPDLENYLELGVHVQTATAPRCVLFIFELTSDPSTLGVVGLPPSSPTHIGFCIKHFCQFPSILQFPSIPSKKLVQPRWMILNGLLCATMTEVPLWSSLASVVWFMISFFKLSNCFNLRFSENQNKDSSNSQGVFMGSDRYCLLDLSTTTQNHHHISHKVHQTLKPTCWGFVSQRLKVCF